MVPALSLLAGRGYGTQENGFRSPTYPLFLALVLSPLERSSFDTCTDAHRAVCIGNGAKDSNGFLALRVIEAVNILLGIGTTLVLYALGWRLAHSIVVAFLFGAGYAWNVSTGFWELSLLTEPLTTFLLTLAVFLTVASSSARQWMLWLLGLVLGVLALCHQLYLSYWIVPTLYLVVRNWRAGWRRIVVRAAPVVVIPLVLIAAWSSFNYFVNGVLTPSTLSGYVLIQMVAPAVQDAPPAYEGITQTYIKYRDAQVAESNSYDGAIYRAWRDILSETGMTWSQVSAKLTGLALYLGWHYPAIYFESVRKVAGDFWSFAFFHYDPVPEGAAAAAAGFTDGTFQQGLNVLFWIAPLIFGGLMVVQRRRGSGDIPKEALWGVGFLYVTVWYAALLSSLTNYGDNARYRVAVMPLQYGVIVMMFWAAARVLIRNVRKQTGAPQREQGSP